MRLGDMKEMGRADGIMESDPPRFISVATNRFVRLFHVRMWIGLPRVPPARVDPAWILAVRSSVRIGPPNHTFYQRPFRSLFARINGPSFAFYQSN